MIDKWGRRLFMTGAVSLILLGLVHSVSFFEKMTPSNEDERQLLYLMSNYRFNLMGSPRSMDDLLRGFSMIFMVGVIGLGALDLALSRERPGLVKRLALINSLWLAAMSAVSLRYFFAAPTSFLVVTLVLFFLAWIKVPGPVG